MPAATLQAITKTIPSITPIVCNIILLITVSH